MSLLRLLTVITVIICASCSTAPERPASGNLAGVSKEKLLLIQARYGPDARARVEQWQHLINENQQVSTANKLVLVNDFFNQLNFVDDSLHWQQEDYWATPIETLASNGGDCEDFTIAKYFTLGELGVPDDCLRLTYVKALTIDNAHMVLTFQCHGQTDILILDNLNKRILPSSLRDDLLPVYSFNVQGLWTADRNGISKTAPGGPGRLSKWMDVLQRIRRGE